MSGEYESGRTDHPINGTPWRPLRDNSFGATTTCTAGKKSSHMGAIERTKHSSPSRDIQAELRCRLATVKWENMCLFAWTGFALLHYWT